jgi:hypothetical protein
MSKKQELRQIGLAAKAFRSARSRIQRFVNRHRLRTILASRGMEQVILVVVIPHLAHLAIPCLRLLGQSSPVVVVDNGLNHSERDWLMCQVPHLPILRLLQPRPGKNNYVYDHARVMQNLASVARKGTVFLDADCYLFKPELMDTIFHSMEHSIIATLFWTENELLQMSVPDTFCFCINPARLKQLKSRFGATFEVSSSLPKVMAKPAKARWGDPVPWPHTNKTFFDTIHILTLAAELADMSLDCIPSEPGDVYHICGTSYNLAHLQPAGSDNIFVLNAHYFHLLIVEHCQPGFIVDSFDPLAKHYGGASGLLECHQAYRESSYFRTTQELFNRLQSAGILPQ